MLQRLAVRTPGHTSLTGSQLGQLPLELQLITFNTVISLRETFGYVLSDSSQDETRDFNWIKHGY